MIRAQRVAWILVALQILSLLVLATLQFRWVGEVSRAERQRLRAGLELGASRVADDFDRELTRAFLHFQTAVLHAHEASELDAAFFVAALESWRERTLFPSLLGELYRVTPTVTPTDGEAGLERLDEAGGSFVPLPWPAELEPLENRLGRLRSLLEPAPPRLERRPPTLLAPRTPAFFVPLMVLPEEHEFRPRRRGRLGHPRPEIAGLAILRLREDALREEILPRLIARHLGDGASRELPWAVLTASDPPRMLFSSDGFTDAARLADGVDALGDVNVEMFHFVEREELRELALQTGLAFPAESFGGPRFWGQRLIPPLMTLMREEVGGWRLVVRHPEGSLESAVRRERRRNLGVGLGILLLLVLSMLMLYAASRRAQRLAGQQVEFVAGISHELRTPLAAIGSLGQNLADGIATEPAQARRYGEMIRRETARLTRMVDQVLEFSGVLAKKRALEPVPVDVGAVVEAAAADLRPLAEEAGRRITVERSVAVPSILGDADALRRAVGNLIHNAIKYGGDAGTVEVRVRRADGRVEIAVSDAGPGIARQDLPHVFEPFYRGRNATEAQIQGGGLGLSLVRHTALAHGGKITVESTPGEGTTFTRTLPAKNVEKKEGK